MTRVGCITLIAGAAAVGWLMIVGFLGITAAAGWLLVLIEKVVQ